MSSKAPTQKPYGRHVLVCTQGSCAESGDAEAVWQRFGQLNRKAGLNRLQNPHRVKCSTSDCLGVCTGGPLVVVYPEGIWYHGVDLAAAEEIHRRHLLGGEPVEEFIFHRHTPPEGKPEDFVAPSAEEPKEAAPTMICGVPVSSTTTSEVEEGALQGGQEDPYEEDEEAAEAYRTKVRKEHKKKGLVIVNTGNGKGKTTAALGIAMRSWGRRMRVGVVQFLKPPKARFGEIVAGREMGIDWIGTGDGWTWRSKDMDETEARARHGWSVAQEKIQSDAYDVLVLDEFTYPLHYGWLETSEVISWLGEHKPPKLHLVVTGRYAPPELVDFADLVTEMRPIKHPFKEQGIKAQPGIEF